MAIWFKPGFEDAIMLAKLQKLAEGFDQDGNRVSHQVQMAAFQQWQEVMRQKQLTQNDTLRAKNDQSRAESDRTRAESDRMRAEAEVEILRKRFGLEEQRLQIEVIETVERLQIEKARVVVAALEVAVHGGADPTQVLAAIQDLSKALAEKPDMRQIEDGNRKQLTDKKRLPSEAGSDVDDAASAEEERKRKRQERLEQHLKQKG